MAIKVGGTTVVDDSRNICSVVTVNSTTVCAVNVCATGAFYGSGAGLTNIPGVATTVCPTNICCGTVCLDTANYNYFRIRSNATVVINGLTSNTTPNFYLDIVTTQGAGVCTSTTNCIIAPYTNFATCLESAKRLIQFVGTCGVYYGRVFSSSSGDSVASYAGNALTYQAFGGNNFAASCVYPGYFCMIPTDTTLCAIPNGLAPACVSGSTYYYKDVSDAIFKCCQAWTCCCIDSNLINVRFGDGLNATCAWMSSCINTFRKITYNNSYYLVKSGLITDGNSGCKCAYLMSAKYNPTVTNSTGYLGMHCPCTWIGTAGGANDGDQQHDPIISYSLTNDWIAVASARCQCNKLTVYKLSCFLDKSTSCILQTIQLGCTSNCRDLYAICTNLHAADICTYPAVLVFTCCAGPHSTICCTAHHSYKFWNSGGCTGCPVCYSYCLWTWIPSQPVDAACGNLRTGCAAANSTLTVMSRNGAYMWWSWKQLQQNCMEWCIWCDKCFGNCTTTCWVGVCGFTGWGSGESCTTACYTRIVDEDLCHMLAFGYTNGSNNSVQSPVYHGGWTRLSNNTVIASLTHKQFKPCTQGICQGWLTAGYEQSSGFAVRFGCDYVTGCYCLFSCSFPPCCQLTSCGSCLSCFYGLLYNPTTTTWDYGTVTHQGNVRAMAANLGVTAGVTSTFWPTLNLEYNGCSFEYLGPMSLTPTQLTSTC